MAFHGTKPEKPEDHAALSRGLGRAADTEFLRRLELDFSPRVISTWLEEFGYRYVAEGYDPVAFNLKWAFRERGPRIRREVMMHAKRLADRATMAPAKMVGRASVIT